MRKKKTTTMMTTFIRAIPRDFELFFEQVQDSRQKVHCRSFLSSVREVLIGGRPSKGGICMCVKDGGDFLGDGEKGASGLLVYMSLRSFFRTFRRATFHSLYNTHSN